MNSLLHAPLKKKLHVGRSTVKFRFKPPHGNQSSFSRESSLSKHEIQVRNKKVRVHHT
jgi:hypothetical protein